MNRKSIRIGTFGLLMLSVGILCWGLVQNSLGQGAIGSQPGSVRFELVSISFTGTDDAGGSWAFDEGPVLDAATGAPVGYYQNVFRNFPVTSAGPNAANIQLTIFLNDATDTLAPSSIIMMGTHSFSSGHEQGSVVAAGGFIADQLIGRDFELDPNTNVLTIFN